jgi:arylsulfatase A-like enzyme
MKIPAPLLPALSLLALCATIMPAHSQAKPNNPPLREEYRDQTLPALMKAADPSKPFFLMMSDVDPHHPFAAQMFGLPEKPTYPGEVPPWPFQQVENDTLLEQAVNYYNCVRRLDIGVGMLMEKLKTAGKDENTDTIFLGDHGPPFSRTKTTCYEAGLHVPFLLRWPIRRSGNFTISRPTRGSSTTPPSWRRNTPK